MTADDPFKKIQDAILHPMMNRKDGMPDADGAMEKLIETLQEFKAAGTLPDDLIDSQIANVMELQAQSNAITDALEAGDAETADRISQAITESFGLGGPIGNIPEIFHAIEDGDIDAVREALKTWDVNEPHGEYDKTALYAATSNMFGVSLDIIRLLLDAGADPRKGLTDSNVLHGLGFGRFDGISPHHLAEVISLCTARGAEIEQSTNQLGWTPLHTALSEWNPVATEALLLAGADPNACTRSGIPVCFAGQNGLMIAADQPDLTEILLRHGADPMAKDANGVTAMGVVEYDLKNTREDDYRQDFLQSQKLMQNHLAKN